MSSKQNLKMTLKTLKTVFTAWNVNLIVSTLAWDKNKYKYKNWWTQKETILGLVDKTKISKIIW